MPECDIKEQFDQETLDFLCSEDQDIISAATMNGIELSYSYCPGIFTSCASMILERFLSKRMLWGLMTF